ncbi:TPA: hypothetical protein EYP44_05620 [Candidatus Bathyarchaeota archaeon]|nr:hypothetical protein [Candidatus Bathyarchaeota archaeon]
MKEGVDVLIKGAVIITMDPRRGVFGKGSIAIDGDRIVAVGRSTEIDERYRGDVEIDGRRKIAIPGLVDAHTYQILLRSALSLRELAKHPIWMNVPDPFESMLTAEEARLSAELCCLNMMKMGTTCFAEAGGPHPDILGEVVERAGLRACITRSTMDAGELPENMRSSAEEALRGNLALVERWRRAGEVVSAGGSRSDS